MDQQESVSIPSSESTDASRRDFLKKLGLFMGGLTILGSTSFIAGCSNANSTPTGIQPGNPAASVTVDVSSLKTNGSFLVTNVVDPNGATIIIYRSNATSFEAHSMQCTHQGCEIGTPDSNAVMNCPCHGAQFDVHGNVLSGPANQNLTAYATTFDATSNTLLVKFR